MNHNDEKYVDNGETQDLNGIILQFLEENPGSKARQIANSLNIEKKEINSRLYGDIHNKCYQDNEYRWFVGNPKKTTKSSESSSVESTTLGRLCRYYSACIAEDMGAEISVFADSKFGLDYRELRKLPLDDSDTLFSSDEVGEMINTTRNTKTNSYYFGYPIAVSRVHSTKSNWEGCILNPIFLYPIIKDEENNLSIDWNFPIINKTVVKNFTGSKGEELVNEIVILEEVLGLMGEDEQPEIDELAQRLKEVRPEWYWNEEIDPYNLPQEPQLRKVFKEGIYNRALILKVKEKPSSYTRGLEYELNELSKLTEEDYKDTALGKWLQREANESNQRNSKSLLEVFPVNMEQREAINKSLIEDLTVITGPPGTGKSQVVSNLIINSRWQEIKLLFASKNNKAVDVVETRVNCLSDKPVLLRLGGKNQQSELLVSYISNLLSSSLTEEEKMDYMDTKKRYESLQSTYVSLGEEESELLELRNKVDKTEIENESIRKEISENLFISIKTMDIGHIIEKITPLINELENIKYSQSNIVRVLIHKILKASRYAKVSNLTRDLDIVFESIEIKKPLKAISDVNIKEWLRLLTLIVNRISTIQKVKRYHNLLTKLGKQKSLEEIAKERLSLINQMSTEAHELWDLYLKFEADNLTHEERSLLSQYRTTLQMVTGDNVTSRTWRSYYSQSEQVSHILSCMAITSLSTKGRIPFQAGIFDLVVFDEASQCDIASALPLLYRAKKAVVIGDPNQLKHISSIHKKEDQRLLEKYGLMGELNDWAYSYNSLYDLAAGLTLGGGIVDLRDHYRSHEDIINFSNQAFYEGRLRVATKYDQLKKVNGNEAGIRWINVKGKPERPESGSGSYNIKEAEAIVKELKRLVDEGYSGTIGVVSPFRSQANLINTLVSRDENLLIKLNKLNFLCQTVHMFQGDERDVIVFSPVVGSDTPQGSIVFLNKTRNLFNVAITRARAMLIVIGDKKSVSESGIDYMVKFVEYFNRLDISDYKKERYEQTDLGPDYPTVARPERVSDWERLLYKKLYQSAIPSIPQFHEERYVLDLAVFSANGSKLNIEVDGEYYHKDWNGELCYRDQMRNQRMFELGWDVKRFWVYQVRDDIERCVKAVKDWINANQQIKQ